MFQSINKYILSLFKNILFILVLFFIIVFFQNNTTMIITMESSKQQVLNPQFYYANNGESLSESNSAKSYKVKNNQYYFKLPSLKHIKYARFDPAKILDQISIKKITIIESCWFSTNTYQLPVIDLRPAHHINHFMKKDNSIIFNTIGNDSQFNINFLPKKISHSNHKHLKASIIALLSYMIMIFLYKVYKTVELDNTLSSKLIIYSLFLALAIFKVDYYKDHVKKFYPPDELAHLAYIDYVHKHNEIIPKFEHMRMLNNKKAGNYLSHPPLYYQFMNIVYDDTKPIYKTVTSYRELNILIFLSSFILLLYLSFNTKISIWAHFTYLTVLTSIPMYAYSGASITNDNLAIFGAVIFMIGLKKIFEKNYNNSTYLILALGIFLAYFSKLTAAILIFFAAIYFIIYTVYTKHTFKITKIQIAIISLTLIPIIYYQLYIIFIYHSLLPTFNVTYPEQYLNSVFFIPEEFRQHLSAFEWLGRMKKYIIGGWFGIHSHHSFVKNNVIEYMGLLILHILALLMLFLKCPKESTSYCKIGKIGILSLFMVLIIQFLFSYKTHLVAGYMGGLQPRYLLPFMFAFAIMASLFVERFKQYFLFNIFVILICIHAIYSDFFYFLQYYQ